LRIEGREGNEATPPLLSQTRLRPFHDAMMSLRPPSQPTESSDRRRTSVRQARTQAARGPKCGLDDANGYLFTGEEKHHLTRRNSPSAQRCARTRSAIGQIPKPCVAGSNPAGGAEPSGLVRTRSSLAGAPATPDDRVRLRTRPGRRPGPTWISRRSGRSPTVAAGRPTAAHPAAA